MRLPTLFALTLALACTALPPIGAASAQDATQAATPAPDAMAVQPDAADYVGRADSVLMFQGTPRRFAGLGVSWLGLIQAGDAAPRWPTQYETGDILTTVQAMGSGFVRAVSLGASAGCPACLIPASGRFNPDALRHMDAVLRQAHDAGIKIVIPLAGGHGACPADADPDPVADTACVFARWRSLDAPAFYTDPAIRAEFAAYVTKIITHINPLTGIAYKDDPTIMAWENCDGCGRGMAPQAMADWTEFLGRTIKLADTHHLYENGAFAGRLGKQPGHVPIALVAQPSVDIIGDRVMPGIDAGGAGVDDAVDEVTRANRVYVIDAYGWTPAQWATPDALQAFFKAVIKNRAIAGGFLSELSGHADQGGYLPAGPQGPALYFPGTATPAADLAAMQARARAVRRFSFGMNDLLTIPFSNVGRPEIISATHGRVVWRGAAGATSYGIARSGAISVGGSWKTLCDRCLTDAQPSYQDPAPSAAPAWYRMQPFNANDHSGLYSEPFRDK